MAWADPRLAGLAGYEPDELPALGGFFGLVAAADADELHRRNQSLLAGDTTGPIRYRLRRKGGDLLWVQDTARAERKRGTGVIARVV